MMVNGWETYGFEVQLFEDCVEKPGCMAFSWHGFAASNVHHGVGRLRAVLCCSAQKGKVDCNSSSALIIQR